MTGHHDGVGRKREQLLVDRGNDGGEISPRKLRGAGPTRKQRVTGEEHGRAFDFERHRPGSVTRIVDRVQPHLADFDDLFVIDEDVVADLFQIVGIGRHHADFIPRLAHLGDGADVVEVSVCLKDSPNSERCAQLEQQFVFIRGINEDRIAGVTTPHDEHVVVVAADHHFVHFDRVVVEVQSGQSQRRVVS